MTTTETNEPVTLAFLESKLFTGYNVWAKEDILFTSQSCNLSRLSDSVFGFSEYNYLPSDETDILDGHYTIFVNYKTFQYLLYKSSDYGSLTYVIPCKFEGFLDADSLPESSKKRIESIIAHKLLSAYFYDGDHINHRGASLIEGSDNKRVLITDYRGYIWSDNKVEEYDPTELRALNILCGYVQPDIKDFDPSFIKEFTSKFKRTKGTLQSMKIVVNEAEYTVVHKINKIYGHNTALFDKSEKNISVVVLDHKLKDFVKIIPAILRNVAATIIVVLLVSNATYGASLPNDIDVSNTKKEIVKKVLTKIVDYLNFRFVEAPDQKKVNPSYCINQEYPKVISRYKIWGIKGSDTEHMIYVKF